MTRHDAKTREEWLIARLRKTQEERDQYRRWFERLLPIAWRGDPEARAELDRVTAEYDRVVNARTAANKRRGAETRRKVLEAQVAGKSIAATALDLKMSTSRVARIRGEAKRGDQ